MAMASTMYFFFFLEPVSYKVVVIGGSAVGRHCYFQKYCYNRFDCVGVQIGE